MTSKDLVIANAAEAFLPLIRRYDSAQQQLLIRGEHILGDRAILWGGANKLVVSSLPIAHLSYTRISLGYENIENLSPESPSESLCRDILNDQRLFKAIVQSLSPYSEVRLLSYVASDELIQVIDALRQFGIFLSLVETPGSDGRDVAQKFDTKSGFRNLFSEWNSESLGLAMPPGVICQTVAEAARETVRRLERGVNCLCKADRGESGIGLLWFDPAYAVTVEQVELRIGAEPAFGADPIVVEAAISPPADLTPLIHCPSIEAYISPVGDVQITYACAQLLEFGGHFSGVLIDKHSLPEEIVSQMSRCAEFVGRNLALKGYHGYFDLDFVVGREHKAYVVEGNPRRTGGTHAHDLATFLFGPTYLDQHVILTRAVSVSLGIAKWDKILTVADGLMFRVGKESTGVIPVVTSGLPSGTLGYAVLARSAQAALDLERRFLDAIASLTKWSIS